MSLLRRVAVAVERIDYEWRGTGVDAPLDNDLEWCSRRIAGLLAGLVSWEDMLGMRPTTHVDRLAWMAVDRWHDNEGSLEDAVRGVGCAAFGWNVLKGEG